MDELEPQPKRSRYLDGTKLRQKRIAKGLAPSELAVKAGTSRAAVSHHEQGDYGCLMPQLRAYANALECDPSDLMLDAASAA